MQLLLATLLSLCGAAASSPQHASSLLQHRRLLQAAPPPMPKVACIAEHCAGIGAKCAIDKRCRAALECDAKVRASVGLAGPNMALRGSARSCARPPTLPLSGT